MGMQPRQTSTWAITPRSPSTSSMSNRLKTMAQIAFRATTQTITSHFRYNQSTQPYQSPIAYNYYSSNGQIQTRTVSSPAMKGR